MSRPQAAPLGPEVPTRQLHGGLTVAGRRVRDGMWGVADDGVLLHAGRVRGRVTKEAQQFIFLAQGREGTDSQLHLGRGAAPTRTSPHRVRVHVLLSSTPVRAHTDPLE